MKLSEHFTLSEFTTSQIATRQGIDNRPDPDEMANLKGLANFLEVVRQRVGRPIIVTSGYRCPELNRWVGGSRTSAHMDGRAADIVAPAFGSPADLAEVIAALDLEVDQLILEYGDWVHLSVAENPRHQILTAIRGPAGTLYEAGIVT